MPMYTQREEDNHGPLTYLLQAQGGQQDPKHNN